MHRWQGWAFTFGMLKPELAAGVVQQSHAVDDIVKVRIPDAGLQVLKIELGGDGRGIVLDKSRARQFYQCHVGKFFYPRLVNQISSGPLVPLLLGLAPTSDGQPQPPDAAVLLWRRLIGPTHLQRARSEAPASIRAAYAFSDTLNVAHGADSPANALEEATIIWPLSGTPSFERLLELN